MAIVILGREQWPAMRRAGEVAAQVLAALEPRVVPGVSTAQLDTWARAEIARRNARPSPLGYRGYPAAICTSRNHVVCHGIPRADEIVAPGDIINLDVTVEVDGYHGDTSRTLIVGEPSADARRVVDVARRALEAGIAAVRPGARLGDVGHAIESLARAHGCSVVEEFGGHGIGRYMHMPPHVAHTGRPGTGLRLRPGLAFTIEPIITPMITPMITLGPTIGPPRIRVLEDGWTAVTEDGSPSAQFEHTVLVTFTGVEVLTRPGESLASARDPR